ncbi:hypothetical protein DWB58_27930 [candidate division KSB1 bacterium]|nr:hypothetical protein [candidate division KSB1 bacterium]
MKKLILCLFMSTLLTPLSLFAQPSNYFKLGANYSYLRTDGGKSRPGLTLGVGKDFYPIRSFDGFLGFELGYITKKMKLENKTWPTNMQPEWSDVEVGDVPLNRSYLEFHTKLGYRFSLFHNKAAIGLFVGPLLSFPIKYSSRFLSDSTIFLDSDERGKYEFDYLRCESQGADKHLHWFMGIAVIYKNLGTEMCYDRASRQNCIRGLTINDALDSFHVMLFYTF